ncbi:MAG: DUF4143 domain-containing protein, partial [Candidatus Scalinduaceae bacterium]
HPYFNSLREESSLILSSPKLQVMNTALMSAQSGMGLEEARRNSELWGRLIESAVGASLANGIRGQNIELFYWSSRNREVDFVICRGKTLVAIEVKSGRRKVSLPGVQAFSKEFRVKRNLLVGAQGIPLDEFFLTSPEEWLK